MLLMPGMGRGEVGGYPALSPVWYWWPYYPAVYGPVLAPGSTPRMLVGVMHAGRAAQCALHTREAQFGIFPWVGASCCPKVLQGVTDDRQFVLGTSALSG